MAEGREASEVFEEECIIIEDDSDDTSGGGHAGGGVSSIEELHRPGQHYVITKSGGTIDGKQFAPESTPAGGVHVTLGPGGAVLHVNAGVLGNPLIQHHLTQLQKELKRR